MDSSRSAARKLFGTNWSKLEVMGDEHTLPPDLFELVEAARTLMKAGDGSGEAGVAGGV